MRVSLGLSRNDGAFGQISRIGGGIAHATRPVNW
jgi:hypothetical protein